MDNNYCFKLPEFFNKEDDFPKWCQSDAARFVWTLSQQVFYQDDGSLDEDKMNFLKAVLNGVSKNELTMFAGSEMVFDGIRQQAEMMIEKYKVPKRNDTIDELIRKFVEFDKKDPFISIDARKELKQRFEAQSHQDQIRILRTFLESVDDIDHEWCCKVMQTWWDDCLVPDVKWAWETYSESCCAGIVAKWLPLEYVMEHQEALEYGNYAAVCWRLATTKDYEIYENDLTRMEFLDIAVHNHWTISDDDADELLFGFILDILDDQCVDPLRSQGYGHGLVHDGVKIYTEPKRFLEPKEYSEPSLLHIVDMPFYVNAMGKLGKASTLQKLYNWNKRLKDTLANHITNPDNYVEIVGILSESYATYMKYIWKRFMETASNKFSFDDAFKGKDAFRKTHNKYHFEKQEQKEYYPGYPWEEEGPF